ncbi:hypothetical protein EUX98_g4875 [Antrodiella citrinella]|uniref:Uncharacterized protein n=1 Tax=Antrodiella citrinella TaxID=2447956 RepID=A0A4S4MSW9_9APHY|nr:hypothetical protein EUX98_g4875 [Antrodiella citrinella]
MWLSNIPDYTHGLLNTAVYLAPSLDDETDATVAANCLVNTGSWRNGDEFCYNYTLLLTADVPRFLGCRIMEIDPWGLILLRRLPTPRPLHELASFEEFNYWLAKMLFCTLIPGTPSHVPIERVNYPNNLKAFVDLLIHLHRVGFPAHWLSGILTAIVSDNLYSGATPYLGSLPIPSSERTKQVPRRKVNLRPWQAELENILAVSHEALAFPVTFPVGFALSPEEISFYSVEAPRHLFKYTTAANFYSPFISVMGLLFFKPGAQSADQLAANVQDILEGKMGANGTVQILTMVDTFDIQNGKIQWAMSREKVRMMRAEGWVMTPPRFDTCGSVVYQPFLTRSWVDDSWEAQFERALHAAAI